MSQLIQAVTDDLDLHNASPVIIQKVPGLVKRAIQKLRSSNVIPPKIWRVSSDIEKEELRDEQSGTVLYNFISLPEDFYQLDELVVNDNGDPYLYTSSLSSLYNRAVYDLRKLFTVQDINLTNELDTKKIMALSPYPTTNVQIEVRYYFEVTDNFDVFPEKYWEAIIKEVESIVGITTPFAAESAVLDLASEWKRQKGGNNTNKTFTTTKPTFFKGRKF